MEEKEKEALLGFLRACGGVSPTFKRRIPDCRFSPRVRRCFARYISERDADEVFSARAEVFLRWRLRESLL